MTHPIQGVLPIAHTPFLDDDSLDLASLKRQIDWAYSVGADGFGTGMVSELLRLTYEERVTLTQRLAEINDGRGAFFAGVGAESTSQAVQYAILAEAAGADAVMAIPPLSTRLGGAAVRDYFIALADAVAIPVIVQDASGYVGQPIPISICVELLKRFGRDKILFKPEASPIGPNLSALRDATSGEAQIFEGSGGVCLVDSFRRGIVGTMPGMEFLPGIIALWNALKQGNDQLAYGLYFPICALVSLQLQAGLDGFLAVEKYIMHQRGLFTTDRRRQPYSWSLDHETQAELDRLLAQLAKSLSTVSQW